MGNPLDPTTMMGAQASHDQMEKILGYINSGNKKGEVCIGVNRPSGGDLENGYYIKRRSLSVKQMRVFQEEIFAPCSR